MSSDNKSYSVVFRADELNRSEAEKLESAFIEKQREIAPDARGTSAIRNHAKEKELSAKKTKKITS